MNSGIYKIYSINHPDRIYIGSAKDLRIRKNTHFSSLKRDNHPNYILQAHFKKYGIQDLIFEVIEPCPIDQLIIREQFYIDSIKPSFNICQRAGNTIGRPQSKETRLKRSLSLKGVKLQPEVCETMRKASLIRFEPEKEINHFLLLSASSYGDPRKHIYLCCVCGNTQLLTAKQVRASKCNCRKTSRLKDFKPKEIKDKYIQPRNILYKTNSTGYPGIVHTQGKYRARVKYKGKLLHAGYYNTPQEAFNARVILLNTLALPIVKA